MNLLNQLEQTITQIGSSLRDNFKLIISILAILWVVQIINTLLGQRLNWLGIYPRKLFGLPGIVCSPFLHGSFGHLLFNSIPFVVLSALILLSGPATFWGVSCVIVLISGTLTWLFGRNAFHVGASAMIMGYWGFLLSNAYFQRSMMAAVLAFICLYYFSGFILSLFPQEERVSWEGHLLGFVSGVLVSYAMNNGYPAFIPSAVAKSGRVLSSLFSSLAE